MLLPVRSYPLLLSPVPAAHAAPGATHSGSGAAPHAVGPIPRAASLAAAASHKLQTPRRRRTRDAATRPPLVVVLSNPPADAAHHHGRRLNDVLPLHLCAAAGRSDSACYHDHAARPGGGRSAALQRTEPEEEPEDEEGQEATEVLEPGAKSAATADPNRLASAASKSLAPHLPSLACSRAHALASVQSNRGHVRMQYRSRRLCLVRIRGR